MNKYMIRPLIYWFTLLAILLAMVTLPCLVSCGRKPVPGVDRSTVDISKTSRDSSNVINRNLAIIDSLKLRIGDMRTVKPECDSVCQEAFDRALAQFNMSKTSGENSYGLYYDKYKQLLVAYFKLGETLNQKIIVAANTTRTVTITITRNIPVQYTPWYMKYSAWFGWAAAAIFLIRFYLKRTVWFPKIFTT